MEKMSMLLRAVEVTPPASTESEDQPNQSEAVAPQGTSAREQDTTDIAESAPTTEPEKKESYLDAARRAANATLAQNDKPKREKSKPEKPKREKSKRERANREAPSR